MYNMIVLCRERFFIYIVMQDSSYFAVVYQAIVLFKHIWKGIIKKSFYYGFNSQILTFLGLEVHPFAAHG